MDDVAQQAGVGLGTVYRHFPTKAALAAELVGEGLADFTEQADKALNSSASPWDAFVTTVTQNLELAERDVGTRHAVAQMTDQQWDTVQSARSTLHSAYARLIQAAQDDNSLRRDFNSADLEMVLRAICSTMDSGQSDADWRRHLHYLLDGLRVESS
jgi:AcrR family transcriptional regulator